MASLLTHGELSSALTRTASYQMTICTIEHADYLLRRIRGEKPNPLHTAGAKAAHGEDARNWSADDPAT